MAEAPINRASNLSDILQINTLVDNGGAARVMLRLHQQYLSRGFNSWIINKKFDSLEQNIISLDKISGWANFFKRFHNSFSRRIDRWIGLPHFYLSTNKLLTSNYVSQADIIHIHNLHGRYLNYLLLAKFAEKKPIIWTLHDMWAFTGHCTYSYDCDRWRNGCGKCPLFRSENKLKIHPSATWFDFSKYFWRSKRNAFNKIPIHIVSPSNWLYELATESFFGEKHIFHHIPNGIDLNIFQPLDKGSIRDKLGIPHNIPVILFIAADSNVYRKGIQFLLRALQGLPEKIKLHVLVVGKQTFPAEESMKFSWTNLGLKNDEKELAEVYNAADLFAFPSLADNHPLVALESLACGTPIIAFNTGGVPEIVRQYETGYLAKYANVDDFTFGIELLVNNPELRLKLSHQCRQVAMNEYSIYTQADKYLSLYQEIIDDRKDYNI